MPHEHFYINECINEQVFSKFNPVLYYSGFVCDEPKWKISKHAHSFCEIIYICQGDGNFIINGSNYYVTQGDIIIYNNGENHEEISNPDNPLKTYFCGIGNNNSNGINDLCPPQFLNFSTSPVVHCGIYSETFEKYISELVYESSSKNFGYTTICSNVLSSMFILIRRIIDNISDENDINKSKKELISTNVIEFIKDNRNNNLSVNDIAKHFYISKDYLAHKFKSETGVSPINYLLMLKIDEAKHLLSSTDKTISEISFLIGYDDANYVSQLFKKMTGTSPTEFRKGFLKEK